MFAAFLASFMVPEISMRPPFFELQVTVPVPSLVLGLWAILSVPAVLTQWRTVTTPPLAFLMLFGGIVVLSSLLSGHLIAMVYAVHFAGVVALACLLVPTYIARTIRSQTTRIPSMIMLLIFAAYGIGTLASLWTGPLNPEVGAGHDRYWGGMFVVMATGFGENHNVVAALLLIMIPTTFFVVDRPRAWIPMVLAALLAAALLATLSRSGILAFGAAVVITAMIHWRPLRDALKTRPRLAKQVAVGAALLSAAGALLVVSIITGSAPDTLLAIAQGLTGTEVIRSDLDARFLRWNRGVSAWLSASPWQQLLGQGFYGSMRHGSTGWSTPHNVYIAVLGDFGLLGVLLLSGFLGAILGSALAASRQEGGWGPATAAFLAVLALVIHNLTGEFLYWPPLVALLLVPLYLYGPTPVKGVAAASPVPDDSGSADDAAITASS